MSDEVKTPEASAPESEKPEVAEKVEAEVAQKSEEPKAVIEAPKVEAEAPKVEAPKVEEAKKIEPKPAPKLNPLAALAKRAAPPPAEKEKEEVPAHKQVPLGSPVAPPLPAPPPKDLLVPPSEDPPKRKSVIARQDFQYVYRSFPITVKKGDLITDPEQVAFLLANGLPVRGPEEKVEVQHCPNCRSVFRTQT